MIFIQRLFALFRNYFHQPTRFFYNLFDKKQAKHQSILVALSGSQNDGKSIAIAKNLIQKKTGILIFVHVLEIDLKNPLDVEIQEKTSYGDKILSEILKKQRIEKYNHKLVLLQARDAGPAIIFEAANQSAEVIIICDQKNNQQGVFNMSKTIKYVLTNSGCDVLLIHT